MAAMTPSDLHLWGAIGTLCVGWQSPWEPHELLRSGPGLCEEGGREGLWAGIQESLGYFWLILGNLGSLNFSGMAPLAHIFRIILSPPFTLIVLTGI